MQITDTPKDKEAQEQSENEEYYNQPCRIDCANCCKEVVSYMTEEYNYYAWVGTLAILFSYGIFLGVPILICFLAVCKNKVHSCSVCFRTLHTKKFSPISIKGVFVEFKFDKCVIILRKVYVYIALAVLLFAAIVLNAYSLIFYNEIQDIHTPSSNKSLIDSYVNKIHLNNDKDISWEDLINTCGSKEIVNNAARAQEIFERKFHKKVVNWKGHFIGAVINYSNPFDFNPSHVVNYYIRMLPSESMYGADVILSLSHKFYQKYKDIHFVKGEPISFTASLEGLGNEWRPYHLHGINISKIEEFVDYDQKIILFKGVNLEIEGKRVHTESKETKKELVKIEKDPEFIEQLKKKEIENKKENETIKNNDETIIQTNNKNETT